MAPGLGRALTHPHTISLRGSTPFPHIRVVFIGNSQSHSTGNSPTAFSIMAGESLPMDPALVGTPSSSSLENENEVENELRGTVMRTNGKGRGRGSGYSPGDDHPYQSRGKGKARF